MYAKVCETEKEGRVDAIGHNRKLRRWGTHGDGVYFHLDKANITPLQPNVMIFNPKSRKVQVNYYYKLFQMYSFSIIRKFLFSILLCLFHFNCLSLIT